MPKARILVVEDNSIEALDLERRLRVWGYEVPSILSSGREAVDKALDIKPDLILMDVLLKGDLNGIDAGGEIKDHMDVPVIYLTAYSDKKILQKAKVTEPYSYILKPFDEDELKFAIEMTLYKHKMDKRLKENEKRFQLLYERTPLPYQSLNEDGYLMEVNQAWLDLLGYSREEVIGRFFGDFMAPEYTSNFKKNFHEFKAVGEVRNLKFDMIRKDGTRMAVVLEGKIGYDEHGNFKQTHCIFQDITEHQEIENALQQNERRYRELFNHISSGVAVFEANKNGTDFIFKDFNRAAEQIEKIPKEEVIGKSVVEVFPGIKDFGLFEVFKRVWKTGKPESHPISMYKDQRIAGWRDNYVYKLPTGEIVAVYDDVTEHKEIEGALIDSKERYKTLVKTSPDPIAVTDLDGKIIYLSPRTLELFGLKDREKIIGRSGLEFILPEDREKVIHGFQKTLKEGSTKNLEFKILGKDGSQFFCEMNSSLIKDGHGKPKAVINVVRDITERKLMEQKTNRQITITEAINKLLQETLKCDSDENVARRCLAIAQELTDSKLGFIGEVNPEGRFDTIAVTDSAWNATKMPEKEAVKLLKNMKIRGYWGRAIKDEKSVIVNDLASDPGWIKLPGDHPQITSFLGIPLKQAGKTIGMIALANKESGYNPEDQQAIETLSVAFMEALYLKRAESDLRISEENYRRIVETANEGIWAVDADYKIDFVNKKMAEMLGYHPADMMGKSVTDFMFEKDLPAHEVRMKARRQGISERYERRFRHKDGDEIWTIASASALLDEEGKFAGSFAMFTDITERRMVEKALRDSEEKYRLLVNTAAEGIILLNNTGKILEVNKKVLELSGFKREELIGKNIIRFLMGIDIDFNIKDVISGFKDFTLGKSVKDKVWTFTNAKGKKISLIGHNAPIKKEGKIIGLSVILEDVTERKKAEDALHESAKRFKQVAESAGEWIWEVNADGLYTYSSPVVEKILGYKPDEIVGKMHFYDLFVPEEKEELKKAAFESFARKEPFEGFVNPNLHKNGAKVILETSGVPILDVQGRLLGYRGLDTDITERKRAEDALRQSEQQLADIINHLPDATLAINREGKIIAWNRAIEKMTGLEAAKMMGKGDYEYAIPFYGVRRPLLIDLIFKTDEEIEKMHYNNIRRSGGALMAETVLPRPRGRNVVLWGKASPLYDERGELSGAIESIRDITDLRHAESVVKESEARLNTIVHSSPLPLFVIGRDHRIIYWSEALEEFSGIKARDMVGTSQQWRAFYDEKKPCMIDLLVDGSIDEVPLWYSGKFNKSEMVEGAYEVTNFIPKTGKWFHAIATAIKDTDGNIIGGVEILEDITERRRAEDALRESAKRFQAVAESAIDAIVTTDVNGNIIFFNHSLKTIFGYSTKEMKGKPLTILMPDRFKKDYLNELERFKSSGKHRLIGKTVRTTGLRKNGTEFPFEMSLSAWKSGGKTYFTSIIRDITERKQAEGALRESEEKYRTLFESDPDYTILLGVDGKILDINQAAEYVTGLSREELIGKPFTELELLPEDEIPLHRETFSRILSGEHREPFESKIIDKHGHVRWVDTHVTAIKKDNKISSVLVISSDITERKKADDEIKASLKEKEMLLQEIHHRVKNNLQIISSLLNLQSSFIKNKEAQKVFRESQNRVRSMAIIHEQLYQSDDLSRINFEDYVQRLAFELLDTHGVARKIKIKLNIEDVLLDLNTAIPCGLIVNELLTNSIKHAFPDGREGEIHIEFRRKDENLVLRVSDDGIGFPEDIDFRNTKTLGLRLINNLVEQVNGTIYLDRSAGTEFKIVFKELEYKKRMYKTH